MIAGYPRELESDVVLRDGSTIHVRPVRASDADGLLAFLEALSPRSRWFRFFSAGGDLRKAAAWAADVDYDGRLGLVATAGEAGRIVAHAVYIGMDPGRAEVAFAVADELHGHGLATILLAHLAAAARDRDIGTFEASVLPENHRMLEVFHDSGFPLSVQSEPGRLILELPTSLTPEATLRFEQRDRVAAAAGVARVLEPSSVALIGASGRPDTIGAAMTGNLVEGGFTGDLHLVNTRGGTLDGRTLHRSVLDVPGPVDLAVVAVPASAVAGVIGDCARKGVRGVVVVSAGFAEIGPEGVTRQRELLDTCRANGMRLIGPNCLGVLNTARGLNATFAPTTPPPGTVGFMSQSGGVGIAVIERARELGLGLSSFVSVGNKADLSGNDLLQYWEADPATEVILLYLESFGNPRRFARIARSRRRDEADPRGQGGTLGRGRAGRGLAHRRAARGVGRDRRRTVPPGGRHPRRHAGRALRRRRTARRAAAADRAVGRDPHERRRPRHPRGRRVRGARARGPAARGRDRSARSARSPPRRRRSATLST